jgi:hypothetical protein
MAHVVYIYCIFTAYNLSLCDSAYWHWNINLSCTQLCSWNQFLKNLNLFLSSGRISAQRGARSKETDGIWMWLQEPTNLSLRRLIKWQSAAQWSLGITPVVTSSAQWFVYHFSDRPAYILGLFPWVASHLSSAATLYKTAATKWNFPRLFLSLKFFTTSCFFPRSSFHLFSFLLRNLFVIYCLFHVAFSVTLNI